jgi:hypothetical protein
MYSYLCPECESESAHLTRLGIGEILNEPCEVCDHPFIVRAVCRISTSLSMPEHFNHSTGRYVTNKRAFTSQLDAKSDEMSARLGYDVKYSEVDSSDQKSLGVNNDDAQNIVTQEADPTKRRAIDKVFS